MSLWSWSDCWSLVLDDLAVISAGQSFQFENVKQQSEKHKERCGLILITNRGHRRLALHGGGDVTQRSASPEDGTRVQALVWKSKSEKELQENNIRECFFPEMNKYYYWCRQMLKPLTGSVCDAVLQR